MADVHPLTETVVAEDGYALAVRRYVGAAPPRAVAVIAGAMAVPQSFYAEFARWLATEGVEVVTFDYRGMGESAPASLRGFTGDILDWAELDCAAIVEAITARHPALPLYWIGHSVGAQVLGLLPNRERVTAMLSIAAGSGYWKYNAAPLRYYVLALWHVIMPLGIGVAGYFPGRRLGTVGDLPAGVARQWRRWCLHEQYLAAEGDDVKAEVASATVPITAWSMQDDEMMTLTGTKALFALYESAPIEIRRLRPKDLGVDKIGHFGFFKPSSREKLWPLVRAWMAARTAARTAAGA